MGSMPRTICGWSITVELMIKILQLSQHDTILRTRKHFIFVKANTSFRIMRTHFFWSSFLSAPSWTAPIITSISSARQSLRHHLIALVHSSILAGTSKYSVLVMSMSNFENHFFWIESEKALYQKCWNLLIIFSLERTQKRYGKSSITRKKKHCNRIIKCMLDFCCIKIAKIWELW